jgi:hypothetical protein
LAHRDISWRRSNSVPFGAKRTFSEPRCQNRIYKYAPRADLNLGIKTFLNGQLVSNIVIDTSAAATDTIDYVASDPSGLTSTSTRTIIVESAATTNQEATTTKQ